MVNYNRLSFEERIKIDTYFNLGWTLMRIGEKLNRSTSTISREITRYPFSYSANKAQIQAEKNSREHNCTKRLEENSRLYNLVYRYLKKRWSPQQIASHLA